ncbi:MAG: hypothetical protein K8T90_20375 [Planctomycetes bacterium]|nr:hypothetical protein [Planctomycetota bacterium]
MIEPAGHAGKKRLSNKAIVLIACAVFAIPCVPLLVLTQGVMPQIEAERQRIVCADHLERLARIFVDSQSQGANPPRSGPAMFLAWRKDRTRIDEGVEWMLLCPNDPGAADAEKRETRALYDSVDLDHPAPGLCSYAVRDFAKFPLAASKDAAEPIAVCLHHAETLLVRGVAVVAYSDGRAAFVGYEELGISEGSELIVGPRSKSAVLRMMTFGDARER